MKSHLVKKNVPLHLQLAGLTRPAPAETPQGRNTARISG